MQGFSDFLDLKIWGHFSGLKKIEFGFPDLKFEVDTLKKFKQKIKRNSKFQNCSKSFPSVQTCFGAFLGKKNFFPLIHGGSSLGIFSKKVSKFHEGQKSCPEVSKRALNKLWGIAFENFLPSVPCSAFQSFWTLKNDFSFPDLKIGVQFSETILNRLSFCIHATVNIRNPISDFLDSKLWYQIPQIKYVSSVFRT